MGMGNRRSCSNLARRNGAEVILATDDSLNNFALGMRHPSTSFRA